MTTAEEFIKGRVIKAVNVNWHPDCFRCELCQQALADTGFVRNNKKLALMNAWMDECMDR